MKKHRGVTGTKTQGIQQVGRLGNNSLFGSCSVRDGEREQDLRKNIGTYL